MTDEPILTKNDFHLMRATLTTIENIDEDPYYVLIHADSHKNQEKRMEDILIAVKLKDRLERLIEFYKSSSDGWNPKYATINAENVLKQLQRLREDTI
ncbi:MAG: hypothetical protein KGH65_05560 [Candidatus Micrarchaeota archaeon]|nr:hypothetical protein [Candidatus Micrarchaeota archaeon]